MKKLAFLLISILVLVSCEGPQGPRGPQGPEGPQGPAGSGDSDKWIIDEYDIPSSAWILNGNKGSNGSYYYADVEDENLTAEIFDAGIVLVYLMWEEEGIWIQQALPTIRYEFEDLETGEVAYYQKMWDFDYSEGLVRVYCTLSDFYTFDNPGDIHIRIIKQWPSNIN